MNAAVLLIVSVTACGECRHDDCRSCQKPPYSFHQSVYSFWCNLARSCDCDRRPDPWPLEYPGARARGWQAQGVAVTRDTPINVGPYAVPVEYDEFGIPHVIRQADPATQRQTPEPVYPAEPQVMPARHVTNVPMQSRFRFISK